MRVNSGCHRLVKIGQQVVHVVNASQNLHRILANTDLGDFVRRELAMNREMAGI